jgi:hypothetical protein
MQPLEDEYFSVQQSKFIFECPLNYDFDTKHFIMMAMRQNNQQIREWYEIKDAPAIILNRILPPLRHLTTYIMFKYPEFECRLIKEI